jgi:hypothetical protein
MLVSSRSICSATSMSSLFGTTTARIWTINSRFEAAMHNVAGKRLTYNELTGMGAATSH